MRKKKPSEILFPVHYSWDVPVHSRYISRSLSPAIRHRLAALFLTNDKDFQHLTRQCEGTWYLAVNVGQDIVYLTIYDEATLAKNESPSYPSFSRDNTAAFTFTKEGGLVDAEEHQVQRMEKSYPTMRAHRRLKLQEVAQLDVFQTELIAMKDTATAVEQKAIALDN